MDLFTAVLDSYPSSGGALKNADLYRRVSDRTGISLAQIEARSPIGQRGALHSPVKRRVRFVQQTLRALGLLAHDEAGGRGAWKLTPKGQKQLTPAAPRRVLVGFSTDLGLALWASCTDVFQSLDEPIALCLTSPPYPLRQPRAYGNPPEHEYVDWMVSMLEPIVRHLMPGGSIVLNVSNDIFESQSPARSLYQERLVLALHSELGLSKMDQLVWLNPSRPPGPVQWASKSRQQLNATWESIYWFTNDPHRCRADNRRVLEPHTERHAKLLADGGERRTTNYGDGAYRLREGSYGKPTVGRIPRNVITQSHRCAHTNRLRAHAAANDLPAHGASMPLALCCKLVQFLSAEGDLVVDPFSGWFKTAKAAQQAGRRWIGTELMGEYVLGAAGGFTEEPGYELHGALAQAA
jgi:site-specific DNA-methyltransferase (cytosine-N4-specific)